MVILRIIKRILLYTTKYISFLINFFYKRELVKDNRFTCYWNDRLACLNDKTDTTGFDAHYIYHIAWAVRRILEFSPKKHIDIASSLYFITTISAYIPTVFYDFRPAQIKLNNLKTKRGNLLSLDFPDNSIESLSCMHVLEHIGLERYGDPFAPQGDLKAISELKRVIKPGGKLFIVVPMGEIDRIQYNAHRIYSYHSFIRNFNGFSINNFSFITDSGDFIEFACPKDTHNQRYGCGCFELTKIYL